MYKKTLLLVLLLINFLLIANAQEEREPGTLYYNNSKDTSTIYFTKEFNQFKNKYVVYRTKSDKDPLCSIVLEYDLISEVINVTIKEKGQDIHKPISFEHNASACIIKNYKAYDTLINISDKCEILFTFQDITKKEKIILNQISSNNSSVTYILTPLRNSYLKSHLKASFAYWEINRKNKKAIIKELNIKQEDDTKIKRIDSLKSVIRKDYYATLKQLKEDEKLGLNNPLKACDLLERELIKALDSLFYEQYKDVDIVLNDWIFTLDLTIHTDTVGKIINIEPKSNLSTASDDYPKLMNPYNNIIKFKINELKLKNKKDIIRQVDKYKELKDRYYVKCYKLDNSMVAFSKLFDSIEHSLHPVIKKEPCSPATYKYHFDYSSQTKIEKWKIVKDNQFKEYYTLKNVEKNKKELYLDKYPHPIRGTRMVYFLEAKSKGKSFPEKLDYAEMKYRYISNIGINLVYIPNKPEINNRVYNLYFINHHMGLFGGFGKGLDGNPSYYEGGMYLAPINYFNVKIGITKLNTDLNAGLLLGISVILPVVQFELGYNSSLHSPYAAAGLNIPFFR